MTVRQLNKKINAANVKRVKNELINFLFEQKFTIFTAKMYSKIPNKNINYKIDMLS